jgi:hypothetical protein
MLETKLYYFICINMKIRINITSAREKTSKYAMTDKANPTNNSNSCTSKFSASLNEQWSGQS